MFRANKKTYGKAGLFRTTVSAGAGISMVLAAGMAEPAHAQPTPDTLVGVCSGVSLSPSVITGILDPVLTGIYGPIENNVNGTLGILSGLLGPLFPTPLSVDLNGLLTTAASGGDIGLNVLAQDGTLVGPADECNAHADSYTLDNPAGISIGGNAITGLGASGEEAQAGEIDSIAIGNRASTDAAAVGSIALGTDATIGSAGITSVAIGAGSSVDVANSVAIGADSTAVRGALSGYAATGLPGIWDSVGEISVGSVGAERQITNVAPGSAPTDAVNVAQLDAVASSIPVNAVQYDDGSQIQVTLGGAVGTIVTNVANGILSAASSDAVNGSQLFATNEQVQANSAAIGNLQVDVLNLQGDFNSLQTQVNNITNGAAGPLQYSDAGTPTVPNGGTPSNSTTLVGVAPGPVGLHNVAEGAIAAGSTDAVNGGQLFETNQAVAEARSTADEALGLASNSVQYDDSSREHVTLNSGGAASTIHNVAAVTKATDAVNVGQLTSAIENITNVAVNTAVTQANAYTDARIEELRFDIADVRKDSSAGTAAALAAAAMPQPTGPGRTMVSAGVGTYGGRSAIAIGASHAPENGRSVFRIGFTYDTREKVGANAGVGLQF